MARKPKSEKGSNPPPASLDRDDLIELMAEYKRCGSTMAEARGRVGQRVKALEEHGFNAKVFNAIKSLINGKNAQAIRAVLNTFDEYVDIMGLRDQGDIEDFIERQPDTRTAMEKAMDGDEVGGKPTEAAKARKAKTEQRRKDTQAANKNAVDDVASGGAANDDEEAREAKLEPFRAAMKDAGTHEAVNDGLAAFTTDHPELEDEAITIAGERLEAISADVSVH